MDWEENENPDGRRERTFSLSGRSRSMKNVAVLRFFCAVSGWKNQVPTFFKARQEKGSLSPACEWFPQTKALVRSNEDGKAQKVRIYAAYRVSQLSNDCIGRKELSMKKSVLLQLQH